MPTAISVTGLGRTYAVKRQPDRVALDTLDLEVAEGSVHGLLGPNGAGKTTLCKILSTVLLPSAGSARILGFDVVKDAQEVRSRLGIVFGGERGLYPRLTATQNLRYWSALYHQPSALGRRRTQDLLDRVGLRDRADQRVETFSRGMKQRLHLARGLIGDPGVLILDEPTTGMDPVAARDFRSLVSELRGEGRTVLLTTHDMAEAEQVCDAVSLIDQGRLITTEDPRTIGHWVSAYEQVVAMEVPDAVIVALHSTDGVAAVSVEDAVTTIRTDADGAAARVMQILLEAGVSDLRTARPSLEDVYLHIIGDRGMEAR